MFSAPRSPWQNPYAERLIGSKRRDCLNHFVILNARHLKKTLALYFAYCHGSRTHLGLDKQRPFPPQVSNIGRIIEIQQLGRLHHRYEQLHAKEYISDPKSKTKSVVLSPEGVTRAVFEEHFGAKELSAEAKSEYRHHP
jgi:hypothetical protein